MKGPQHPFNDSLKLILSKLDQILKNQKINTNVDSKYILLTTNDIMKLLKISKETAINWRTEGILQYVKINGKITYRLSDVQKLIDKNYNPVKKKI